MKRSHVVHLTVITSIAAALTSCKEKPTRYCVDADNKVVDECQCEEDCHASGSHPAYHWSYGGAHGFVPTGTRLNGGSTVEPAEGFSSRTSSGTARGIVGEAGKAAAHGSSGGRGGAGE
jgi:hypothetical protein